MNKVAPRCSEAWSFRWVLASSVSGPSEANAASGRTAANTRAKRDSRLVMHGHPVRHRLERTHARPDRHEEEKSEIEDGQDLRGQLLHVRTGLRTQPAEDHEGDYEQSDHDLRKQWSVADRFHRT